MKQLQYYCGENIDCAIYTSLHNHDDSTPVRAKKGAHAPISRKKDDRLKTESQYGVLFGIYLGFYLFKITRHKLTKKWSHRENDSTCLNLFAIS